MLNEGTDKARRRRVRLAMPALWLGLGAILGTAAWGLSPVTPLAGLHRQGWAMENGLPQNTVQALAQTQDGFLWLGTEVGLVRFDGVGFNAFDRNTKPALPGNDVRCLLAAPDGALWIGTDRGLARLKDGAVTVWTTANGLPADSVTKIAFDTGAATAEAVTAWTEGGAVEIRDGQAVASKAQMPGLSEAAARVVAELEDEKVLPGTRVQAELVDREGALWIGTDRGLVRVVNGRVDRLPVIDPLAAASVLALLEDQEGNLWVGTENGGLEELRDRRFGSVGAHEGLSTDATTALTEDSEGKLWVGTNGGGLNALRLGGGMPGEAATYALPDVLLSSVVTALAAGKNDELWVGTPNGLNRLRGSAIDSFTTADGLPDNYIRSLLVDRDGSVWIGTRRGLAHWTLDADGRTVARKRNYSQASGLGSDWIGAMARDARGDLWVATQAGLSRMRGGRITNFTTANGLSSNAVTTLLARAGGMLLVGTEDHGWNVWDGRAFRQVKDAGSEQAAIHAILDDRLGHLWLETGTGIARCDASRLETATCPHWIEFGAADGLLSREMATNGQPSAWRSADGRLWFATPRGLAVVNPAHFPVNTVPPPVVIERFTVDDADMPLHGAGPLLRVPSGKVHFEFDYAAMSFVAPQKVRYRYKLDGFDHDWIDAGTRRMAYYTNIPPGTYTFRVQAANNDGVWNRAGAVLRFELRPHFYQTIWFYAALGAAAVLLAVLAVIAFSRLRLRRAEREFRAVLGERGRIAREIHDTLAQGYVGVSVQLEVLSELLRRNRMEDAQKQLDAARESVRAGLSDARQSIWALRSQDAGERALPVRLRRMVEQAGGKKLDAEFGVYGVYRTLKPEMEREILRVAQEAIQNGKRHAGAQRLRVRLEYTPAEVALEVRDDGQGFALNGAPDRIESPPGHYGLTGMRERAEGMGGTLRIESAEGEGTAVQLRVPADIQATEKAKEPV